MTDRAPRIDPATRGDRRLRHAHGSYAGAVVRADAVDPVTTELVRLRCADHHDCHT